MNIKEQRYDHDKAHEKLKWINKFTSNLKPFLLSTHHGVYPKYRKKYLAEFAYHFNRRYWPEQILEGCYMLVFMSTLIIFGVQLIKMAM